jgi:hypothetical protein
MQQLRMTCMVALLFLAMAALTSQATAQCVKCEATGSAGNECFECAASANGGKTCTTNGCNICTTYTAGKVKLREDGYEFTPVESDSAAARSDCKFITAAFARQESLGATLKLSPEFIREIGKAHPRFAVALAALTREGAFGSKHKFARLHMKPLPISPEDVEGWLKPEEEFAGYLKGFDARGKGVNAAGLKPIIYEFSLKESAHSNQATLKLKVVTGNASDPTYSSLEIDLVDAEQPGSIKKEWKATGWRVG